MFKTIKKISSLIMFTVLSLSFTGLAYSQDILQQIDASIIQDIKAFHQVNEHLVTSGLPTAEQFARAKEAGVEVVINVIPPLSEESHPDLAAIYNAGLVYYNIPYDTADPIASMELFIMVMNQLQDKNVLIHCAANWRVSFMVDAYYQIVTGSVNENAISPNLPSFDIMYSNYPTVAIYNDAVERHYSITIRR